MSQVMTPQVPVMPQYMMVPVRERNGLGVFGFFVALIGIFIPTGIVSLIGLVICLVALGRGPRGFAAFGVILGLLGCAAWLAIGLALILAAVVAVMATVVGGGLAFVLLQPEVAEVSGDMLNTMMAIHEYREKEQALPATLDELDLVLSRRTDPWGSEYQMVPVDDDWGFDLISSGPDGRFETGDDIRLRTLDQYVGASWEQFGQRMEELGEFFERMDRQSCVGGSAACVEPSSTTPAPVDYEALARLELEQSLVEDTPTDASDDADR